MSLEQTIRDTLVSESMDLDARLQQLVRAGLMPQNTLPLLRKSISKVQMGLSLQGPERDVMATFINSMMYIVLGDDTIFNKARAGAKSYAAEETEVEEAVGDYTVKTVSPADAYKKHTGQKTSKSKVPVDPKTGKTLYQKVTSEEVENIDEVANEIDDIRKTLQSRMNRVYTPNHPEKKDSARLRSKLQRLKKKQTAMKEEAEQIDELSKATLGSYAKKAKDQMSRSDTIAGREMGSRYDGQSPSPMERKHNQRADKRYRGLDMAIDKLAKEEVEELEELSRATVGRYAKRAKDEADYGNPLKSRSKGREMAARKRWGGTSSYVKPARVPATEETQIDELSKETMGRYVKKAADRMSTQGVTAGLKIAKDEKSQKNFDTISKRARGISTAVKKLTKESRKTDALADIAAIKQMNESYKTTFDAALEQYGIKSPSELDEEKRKEFFNFVDQEYKKGDK